MRMLSIVQVIRVQLLDQAIQFKIFLKTTHLIGPDTNCVILIGLFLHGCGGVIVSKRQNCPRTAHVILQTVVWRCVWSTTRNLSNLDVPGS